MTDTREQRIARFHERMAEQARQVEEVKARLATSYGLTRNAKFDRAWDIAWDLGHADGFGQVEMYFDELVDLIKPEPTSKATP